MSVGVRWCRDTVKMKWFWPCRWAQITDQATTYELLISA
jgi:hypothetical protein